MPKVEKPFVGEFRELLEAFVEQKRNLGYKYDTTRERLLRFSIFSLSYSLENKVLSKQLVSDWTSKRRNESAKNWAHRNSDLRQFALYLQNLGYDAFMEHNGTNVLHLSLPKSIRPDRVNISRIYSPMKKSSVSYGLSILSRRIHCPTNTKAIPYCSACFTAVALGFPRHSILKFPM